MIIDREHHVPLAAAALENEKGMYGIAIDHRIPPHEDYDNFVGLHEEMEHFHMKHLMQAGMDPIEAYHEAHDRIATPIESAAVRAHAARLGLDPDQFLDDYKSHWRAGATVAKERSDRPRHPDAHTSRYALDEHELGQKFAGDLPLHKPPGMGVEYGGVDFEPEFEQAKKQQKEYDYHHTHTPYMDDPSPREQLNRLLDPTKNPLQDMQRKIIEDPAGSQKERLRSVEQST